MKHLDDIENIKQAFLAKYKYPPIGNVAPGLYWIPNHFTDYEGYRSYCEDVEKKANEKFQRYLDSELSNI